MKLNYILTLLLTLVFNTSIAAEGTLSTLAQRQEAITKAFEKPEEAAGIINKAQEDGLKVDDNNYIVIIEQDGESYKRVAHFKKEKIGVAVEQVLMNIMREAETKLSGGSGPVSFSFSASDKKMYALVSKYGKLLVFNVCATQEEVDSFLKDATKAEKKKPEEKTPEENKSDAVSVSESSEKTATKTED